MELSHFYIRGGIWNFPTEITPLKSKWTVHSSIQQKVVCPENRMELNDGRDDLTYPGRFVGVVRVEIQDLLLTVNTSPTRKY